MAYIPDSDISQDMLADQFSSSFSTYHTLLDDHINALAEGENVETDDIATDAGTGYITNKTLRMYCKYWICMHLFFDKMGMNNISLAEEEKYRVKYKDCREIVREMKKQITKEMLKNDIDSRMSVSSSRLYFRG